MREMMGTWGIRVRIQGMWRWECWECMECGKSGLECSEFAQECGESRWEYKE